MEIIEIKENKKQFLPLLLLADEQENMIDRYLDRGTMYVLDDHGIKCECVVTDEGKGVLELKNIATVKLSRGKGYGKKLIQYVIQLYKNKYKKMIVGTTENNIPFYVKCGFDKYYKTIKNFFTDNYSEEVWDGDLQCIDMYYYYINLDEKGVNYKSIKISDNK